MTELSPHKIVGLTGISGAGKSTISRLFSDNGYCVIDCDQCARKIAEPNSPFLKELAEKFSADIIRSDGSLDRAKTAALIYSDPAKKAQYSKIIFPYITYNIAEQIKSANNEVLLDAPTLFEAGLDFLCDKIVSVCADEAVCVSRIVARDGISEQQAKERLSSQHSAEFFKSRSDFFILNNGTEIELFSEAKKILKQLKG